MNKRIRNLFIALSGLALSVGAAVGVGLGVDKSAEEVDATSTPWYYRGEGDTQKNPSGWSKFEIGKGYGVLEEGAASSVWYFNYGERFKLLKDLSGWGGSELNSTNLDENSSNHFTTGADNGVLCNQAGFYEIKVVNSTSLLIKDIDYLSDLTSLSATIYRFTNSRNWSNVYLHAWNTSDNSHNTVWPGIKLEQYYFNEIGQGVNIFPTTYTYTNFILHNNADSRIEISNVNTGSDKAWYAGDAFNPAQYDEGGQQKFDPRPWTPVNNKYGYYDYSDAKSNSVRCYAFGSHTQLKNSEYNNATPMTREVLGEKNTRVYTVSVDSMFDTVIFKTAGDGDAPKLTGNLSFQQHNNCAYSTKSFDDSDFFDKHGISIDKALADDWIFHFMHFDGIEHDPEDGDTGACKSTLEGGQNYYNDAVASYNGMENSTRASVASFGVFYTYAQARLNAWASACGQTATISVDGEGQYTLTTAPKAGKFVPASGVIESRNDATIYIVISVTAIALLAVGGYFFLKRKEDR